MPITYVNSSWPQLNTRNPNKETPRKSSLALIATSRRTIFVGFERSESNKVLTEPLGFLSGALLAMAKANQRSTMVRCSRAGSFPSSEPCFAIEASSRHPACHLCVATPQGMASERWEISPDKGWYKSPSVKRRAACAARLTWLPLFPSLCCNISHPSTWQQFGRIRINQTISINSIAQRPKPVELIAAK